MRKITVFALILCMLLCTAACNQDGDPGIVEGGGDDGEYVMPEPADKDINVWYAWLLDPTRAGGRNNIQEFMETFTEDNPDYTVTYTITPYGNTAQLATAIGTGTQHVNDEITDKRDGESLYHVIEDEVIPLFYDCDEHGLPIGWIKAMMNSISTMAWRFSSHRMVADYVQRAYLPAAGGVSCEMY